MCEFLAWGELGRHGLFQRGLDEETKNFPLLLPLRNRNRLNEGRDYSARSGENHTWGDHSGSYHCPAPAGNTHKEHRCASSAGWKAQGIPPHISPTSNQPAANTSRTSNGLPFCHTSKGERSEEARRQGDTGDYSKTDF